MTYVYVCTGPTSRRPMCMDYWADLKITYVFVRTGLTSRQPSCADVLSMDSDQPHCKDVLCPTWSQPMYSDALNPNYPEGPISLNRNPSLLRITTKQSRNHIPTKVGVTATHINYLPRSYED